MRSKLHCIGIIKINQLSLLILFVPHKNFTLENNFMIGKLYKFYYYYGYYRANGTSYLLHALEEEKKTIKIYVKINMKFRHIDPHKNT